MLQPSLQLRPVVQWALSRVTCNALQHALNGNPAPGVTRRGDGGKRQTTSRSMASFLQSPRQQAAYARWVGISPLR